MRRPVRCAAAEIEDAYSAADHLLHQRPIQEHVGRLRVELPERARPGDLELAVEGEAAPRRHRDVLPVDDTKFDVPCQTPGALREETLRQHRSTELAHLAGEDAVERLPLVESESHDHPILLWTADLAAELRREALPELVRRCREIQERCDLPLRHAQLRPHRVTGTNLEEIDVSLAGFLSGRGEQRLTGRRVAQRATVVQERHRDEVAPEDPTPHLDERQDAPQRAVVRSHREICGVVSKDVAHDRAPRSEMTKGGARSGSDERVPLGIGTGEPLDDRSLHRAGVRSHPLLLCNRGHVANTAAGGTLGSVGPMRRPAASPTVTLSSPYLARSRSITVSSVRRKRLTSGSVRVKGVNPGTSVGECQVSWTYPAPDASSTCAARSMSPVLSTSGLNATRLSTRAALMARSAACPGAVSRRSRRMARHRSSGRRVSETESGTSMIDGGVPASPATGSAASMCAWIRESTNDGPPSPDRSVSGATLLSTVKPASTS